MSFLSKLKIVVHDFGKVGQIAAIGVSAFNPAAAVFLASLCRKILEVEDLVPAPGSGAIKKQVVTVDAELQQKALGLTMDPQQLSEIIDILVKAFKSIPSPHVLDAQSSVPNP